MITDTQAPDHVKKAWRVLIVTLFCYLFFYTGRQNFGWASVGIMEELHVSHEAIGWVSFAMLIGYAIGQFINGNLADTWSPKRMICIGGALSVLTNIVISYQSSFAVILVLWGINGYFQSMAWSSGSKIISNWWSPKTRGRAYGLYTMAAGSSSVVTFLISIVMLQGNVEWRSFFRYPVLFLAFSILMFFFIAQDKPDRALVAEDCSSSREEMGWIERYVQVLQNKQFLLASIGIGFQSMARYGLIFWVPVYFLGTQYKENPQNLWLALLLPMGMALGAFSFARIADLLFKGNRASSIRLGMSISAVIAFILFVLETDNYVLIGVLMFMIGFFVYGPQANFWSLVPDILGVKLVGTGTGVMNTFAYFFAALGEPFLGFAIDFTGNASYVFLVIGCISLLCVFTMTFVKIKTY